MLANDSSITGTVTSTGGLSIPGRDPGAGVFGFSSTGAGVPHWARHCAVGAEPRISVTGSHTEATRSSAMDAGFVAPRVSQTLQGGTGSQSRAREPFHRFARFGKFLNVYQFVTFVMCSKTTSPRICFLFETSPFIKIHCPPAIIYSFPPVRQEFVKLSVMLFFLYLPQNGPARARTHSSSL